jgi:hypothetical protein
LVVVRLSGEKEDMIMARRKSFFGSKPSHPELDRLREETRNLKVTEKQLEEQRVSFIYGNSPEDSTITKESARVASTRFLIKQD